MGALSPVTRRPKSSEEKLQNIVQVRFDPKTQDPTTGNTLLHVAYYSGNSQAISALLAKDYDCCLIVNNNYETPICLLKKKLERKRAKLKKFMDYFAVLQLELLPIIEYLSKKDHKIFSLPGSSTKLDMVFKSLLHFCNLPEIDEESIEEVLQRALNWNRNPLHFFVIAGHLRDCVVVIFQRSYLVV